MMTAKILSHRLRLCLACYTEAVNLVSTAEKINMCLETRVNHLNAYKKNDDKPPNEGSITVLLFFFLISLLDCSFSNRKQFSHHYLLMN